MHVAVTFGLLAASEDAFLHGYVRWSRLCVDFHVYAVPYRKCVYTALCVRSFIAARKAREDAIESQIRTYVGLLP